MGDCYVLRVLYGDCEWEGCGGGLGRTGILNWIEGREGGGRIEEFNDSFSILGTNDSIGKFTEK
eukprot:COSAG02_NODE_8716_length_2463_cov_3.172166_1_plen_64_part_00